MKIEVNKRAPDFTISDSQGKEFTLSSYRGQKNIFLVFNRGFVWPYCRKHMAQLRQDYSLYQDRNTIVAAVGPEEKEPFAKYWEENQMPFIGIPDPEHRVADLYGQKVSMVKLGRMPAQMIIDKQGILRHVHYGSSMKDIPSNEEIISLIDDIQAEN